VGAEFVHGQQFAKYLAHSTTTDEHAGVLADQAESMVSTTLTIGLDVGMAYPEHTWAEVRNWGRVRMGCKHAPLRLRPALGCGTGQRATCCSRHRQLGR
jgi:hypothetical protein